MISVTSKVKKICIITTSLGGGGAERFASTLSFLLGFLGHDIYILCTKNKIDYNYYGKFFCLENEIRGNLNLKKIKPLIRYFIENNFDIIIDNRPRSNFFKEYFLYNFIFKASKTGTISA